MKEDPFLLRDNNNVPYVLAQVDHANNVLAVNKQQTLYRAMTPVQLNTCLREGSSFICNKGSILHTYNPADPYPLTAPPVSNPNQLITACSPSLPISPTQQTRHATSSSNLTHHKSDSPRPTPSTEPPSSTTPKVSSPVATTYHGSTTTLPIDDFDLSRPYNLSSSTLEQTKKNHHGIRRQHPHRA